MCEVCSIKKKCFKALLFVMISYDGWPEGIACPPARRKPSLAEPQSAVPAFTAGSREGDYHTIKIHKRVARGN